MSREKINVEYNRLLVEDRARKLASAKSEAEVVALIRISIVELESAVDRLERVLSLPGEGHTHAG